MDDRNVQAGEGEEEEEGMDIVEPQQLSPARDKKPVKKTGGNSRYWLLIISLLKY